MYSAIVFLPLAGALIAGFFGRFIGARGAELITCGLLVIAAVLSWIAFSQVALGGADIRVEVLPFLQSGKLESHWSIRVDTLSAVMLIVVTTVSALVHIYSVGYMHHDPHRPRFFAYLSLFTFAMLMLVTANDFVQLFFGWEGVGLMSYLLIGFWYTRPSACAAAIKAFIVNRVGDFGFALGIFAVFYVFGTVSFDEVFNAAAGKAGQTFFVFGHNLDILTTICLLLFMGAMGKSAQFLLHTWLPDAMEGPTPVSALIHAATMVTAGVFLVCRCSPLFEQAPVALEFVTIIGAVTAIFAATVGMVQNDIKRVIAYSTCSQLGYMFFAAGLSAYGAAMFHLFTHAFFKALLFLGAGSVIHAVSDEQDMRKMGSLNQKIPITWVLMLVGTLSLTGFPMTAGYWSKDAIIEHAFLAGTPVGNFAFVAGVSAAFLTAFYSWRLIFMTFHGRNRGPTNVFDHAHEAPNVMIIPLVFLAFGALAAGFAFKNYFIGGNFEHFWRGSLIVLHHVAGGAEAEPPAWATLAPTLAMAGGFAVSWFCYIRRPDLPAQLARTFKPIYLFLLNKWYFDELYDLIFVGPAKFIGRLLWKTGDGKIIDGLGPDGVSARVIDATRRIVRIQTGYVYHYAFAMLIGIAAIITWFTYKAVAP
jgi:NADH-quinone oxidoreductase subunit L